MLENRWMKVKEIAAYLQISEDLIYKWGNKGKSPSRRLAINGGLIRKRLKRGQSPSDHGKRKPDEHSK